MIILKGYDIFVLSAFEYAIVIPTLAVFIAKEQLNSSGERFILSIIQLTLAFLFHICVTFELIRRTEGAEGEDMPLRSTTFVVDRVAEFLEEHEANRENGHFDPPTDSSSDSRSDSHSDAQEFICRYRFTGDA